MSMFKLLFRQALSASGASNDSGTLAAFVREDSRQAALFWLSDEADKSLHLGYFDSEAALKERANRFVGNPETTPAVALESEQVKPLRNTDTLKALPHFTGVFGTAFSGYLLKEDTAEGVISDSEAKLMLFYTADYRSELLGVLCPEEALKGMTEHYDKRRKRCMLC